MFNLIVTIIQCAQHSLTISHQKFKLFTVPSGCPLLRRRRTTLHQGWAQDHLGRDRDQDRDLSSRDRDETETFTKLSETRPRRDPRVSETRPRRDLFLVETISRHMAYICMVYICTSHCVPKKESLIDYRMKKQVNNEQSLILNFQKHLCFYLIDVFCNVLLKFHTVITT